MKHVFKNEFNEKLVYELEKNGSNILAVMVHGFKSNKDFLLFKKIENDLKKIKIDSLRLDFSGSGESEGDYSNSTINKQVKELNSVIKRSKYKKIILIGHSMGSTVSLIASVINSKILAMVLISPLVFPYITFTNSLLKYSPYVFLKKIHVENIKLLDKFKKLKKTEEKLLATIKKEVIGINMFNEMKTLDMICYAKIINLPVLIIHGKKDEIIPLSHSQYLNYNIKESELVFVNCSHNPFFKKDLNDLSVQVINFTKKLKEKFLK